MGRVVGDGGTAFQVVDMCVLPEHQGSGLGKRIMAALMEQLRDRAPRTAYVSLIADGEARRLYSQYGFVETAPLSVGMALQQGSGDQSVSRQIEAGEAGSYATRFEIEFIDMAGSHCVGLAVRASPTPRPLHPTVASP